MKKGSRASPLSSPFCANISEVNDTSEKMKRWLKADRPIWGPGRRKHLGSNTSKQPGREEWVSRGDTEPISLLHLGSTAE